ncbi:hypothetical protein F5Y16DRAFT_420293 [Xylariaceae sp. FL0255]|nr:hypothetical protein F5Y16DRAFT_420293 [Xylariaceae sp. FL0255]
MAYSPLPCKSETETSIETIQEIEEDGAKIATDFGESAEQPKVALHKTLKSSRTILHLMLHVFPVAITISIGVLTFLQPYLGDEDEFDSKTWQLVFQFPAKVHENLIIASISAVVLHIFRRRLVGKSGLPLGLIVGPSNTGSFTYLASPSFRAPLFHHWQNRGDQTSRQTILVAVALACATVYVFAAGPASAALLVPTLDWWNMTNPLPLQLSELVTYVNHSRSALFPIAFQESDISSNCLNTSWRYNGCPDNGYNTFLDWSYARSIEGYYFNVTESPLFYPTMINPSSGQTKRDIILDLSPSSANESSAAIGVTIHASTLALIDAFWHYVEDKIVGSHGTPVQRPKLIISSKTHLPVPLVQVQCDAWDYQYAMKTYTDLEFATNNIFDFSAYNPPDNFTSLNGSTSTWLVPREAWQTPFAGSNVVLRWVDAGSVRNKEDQTLNSSLAVVINVPTYGDYDTNQHDTQESLIVPCVVDARWAFTETSFDPINSQYVETTLTDALYGSTSRNTNPVSIYGALDQLARNGSISGPISLSSEWAAALNSPKSNTSFPVVGFVEDILRQAVGYKNSNHSLKEFLTVSPNKTIGAVDDEIALTMSSVIADWLSRSTLANTNFTVVTSQTGDDVSLTNLVGQDMGNFTIQSSALDQQTEIRFYVQRYGYSWGYRSYTTIFSIAFLLLHVLLVIVYFTYSSIFFFSRKGWTSTAWDNVAQLMTLAILSPPAPELRNCGAGVESASTWNTTFRIREQLQDHENVALLSEMAGGFNPKIGRLSADTKYS